MISDLRAHILVRCVTVAEVRQNGRIGRTIEECTEAGLTRTETLAEIMDDTSAENMDCVLQCQDAWLESQRDGPG